MTADTRYEAKAAPGPSADTQGASGTGRMGFRSRIPSNWNTLWVVMWLVTAPALIVSAFFVAFPIWIAAAAVGFALPEAISVHKKLDSLPPLTHTIRHFLPNQVAFPLIYFSLGSVGAHWLQFGRTFAVGALLGVLGWLTDHFVVTYARPDPFPFSHRAVRPGTEQRVTPA